MKKLLCILFLTLCSLAHGQDLQPIKQILENGLRTNDKSQISYALKRCVTLNLVMGNWMQEKGGESLKPAVENYFSSAVVLSEISFEIENNIERDRKIKLSTKEELEKGLMTNIKLISPLYIDRLSKNYAATGSYFEKDEQLKDEILICSNFTKYLKTLR